MKNNFITWIATITKLPEFSNRKSRTYFLSIPTGKFKFQKESILNQKYFNFEKSYFMNPLLQRISIDPNVCFGKPCIIGTRIWVSLMLDFLASGTSFDENFNPYLAKLFIEAGFDTETVLSENLSLA